jgi:hypothetical protein
METLSEVIMICILTYILYCLVKSREHLRYQDPMIDSIRQDLVKLHPKAKELTYAASDKSFTEDKKDMFLCLKDDNGQYYSRNFLLYVAIHELAHAISKSYDDNHNGKEFNENFDMLLEKASRMGIYDKTEHFPDNYCGVEN